MSDVSSVRCYGYFYNIFVRETLPQLGLKVGIVAEDNSSSASCPTKKYYAMQVERVSNSFPPLSNVKVNDSIIAINCVSVLSCSESFSQDGWNNDFYRFSYPMLICLFRSDSSGTGLFTPSQIPYHSRVFHIGHVYGVKTLQDAEFIQKNFSISFKEDLSERLPECLTIRDDLYESIPMKFQLPNPIPVAYSIVYPQYIQMNTSNSTPLSLVGSSTPNQVVFSLYQTIVSGYQECVKYDLIKPFNHFQQCATIVSSTFENNRVAADYLQMMCKGVMEKLKESKDQTTEPTFVQSCDRMYSFMEEQLCQINRIIPPSNTVVNADSVNQIHKYRSIYTVFQTEKRTNQLAEVPSEKVRKVISVYPCFTRKDELVRERFRKEPTYTITTTITEQDASSTYPDLLSYAYISQRFFSRQHSTVFPMKLPKELCYGEVTTFSVPSSQVQVVLSDLQGRSSIGEVSTCYYGEQPVYDYQIDHYTAISSFQLELIKYPIHLGFTKKEVGILRTMMNQLIVKKGVILEEWDRVKRFLFYSYIIVENWYRGNKKSVLILPSRKDFYLLKCLLDYIGASFIPCIDASVCSLYELHDTEGVTTHQGVMVIDFFNIMAFEMSKDLKRKRSDQMINWLDNSQGVMIIDYCCNEKMEYAVGNKDVNANWRYIQSLINLQQRVKKTPVLYGVDQLILNRQTLSLMMKLDLYGPGCPFPSLDSLLECLPTPQSQYETILKRDLEFSSRYFNTHSSMNACTILPYKTSVPGNMITILPMLISFWTTTYETFEQVFEILSFYEDRHSNRPILSLEDLINLEYLNSEYFWDYYWLHFQLFWRMIHLTTKIPDIVSFAKKKVDDGKQMIILLDSMYGDLMKFTKDYCLVYTQPPVMQKYQAFCRKYSPMSYSVFTTKFLVEPRYIIQHLVDKVFAFFKPLGRMKTAIAQLIYSGKPDILHQLKIEGTLENMNVESVQNYHLSVIDSCIDRVKSKVDEIKVPVGPYDVIVNQLGGVNTVAEVSERGLRLVVHTPGIVDESTIQLRHRMEKGDEVMTDYLDSEYFFIENRGTTWRQLYQSNRKEWESFCCGDKSICMISSAVSFPFIVSMMPSKNVEIMCVSLSEDYVQSLSLIQYFSSLTPNLKCHVFEGDVLEKPLVESFIRECMSRGSLPLLEDCVALKDDIAKEIWRVFKHSILQPTSFEDQSILIHPSAISCQNLTEEDKLEVDQYNEITPIQKIGFIRSVLSKHQIDMDTFSSTVLFSRLADCNNVVKEIVMSFYNKVAQYMYEDYRRAYCAVRSIGNVDCEDGEFTVKKVIVEGEQREILQVTKDCSLPYNELMKLHYKGLMMKDSSRCVFVYSDKQPDPNTWTESTIIDLLSPQYGRIPLSYSYGEIHSQFKVDNVTQEEWDNQLPKAPRLLYFVKSPFLRLIYQLHLRKQIHSSYHICQVTIKKGDGLWKWEGLRLTEEDVQLFEG